MSQLPGLPWGDISTGVLLAFAVVLILSGRIVPKSTHDREIADKDNQIAWLRADLTTMRELATELGDQNGLLLDAAKSGISAAEALQRIAQEET